MQRVASERSSACASVLATTKLTPSRLDEIILLTALPPAPPTPITVMVGFRMSFWVGSCRLRLIRLATSVNAAKHRRLGRYSLVPLYLVGANVFCAFAVTFLRCTA